MNETSHHQSSESESKRGTGSGRIRTGSIFLGVGLAIVALLCLVLAACDAIWGLPIARGIKPESGGSHAPLLLATAAAIAILPRVRRFKFGDLEIEAMQQSVEVLKSEVKFLATGPAISPGPEGSNRPPLLVSAEPSIQADLLRRRAPPLAQEGLLPLEQDRVRYRRDYGPAGWDSDPNKDLFGGKAAANGREVIVQAIPVAGPKSSICRILITVRAQAGSPPLTDSVRLYLHPTFGRFAVQDLEVDATGTASDEITAAGAFTIGLIADNGATRLEYDLKKAPGATRSFKNG